MKIVPNETVGLYDFLFIYSNVWLSWKVQQIQAIENMCDLDWPFSGCSRSKKIVPIKTSSMTSYLWKIITITLSCNIFDIGLGQNGVIMGVKKQICPPPSLFFKLNRKWTGIHVAHPIQSFELYQVWTTSMWSPSYDSKCVYTQDGRHFEWYQKFIWHSWGKFSNQLIHIYLGEIADHGRTDFHWKM